MNEFSQSVSIPICQKSISRQLSNLWLSQENCCENTDDFVENRKNRVRWFRNRLHWTIQEQWNKIIFSDEMWYWTRAIKRFALFDLLKSLYSDTKILSKYIPSL